MTLDEAITYTEKVAEENQRVVDTGIVFNDVTIDMLYCDDTEVIEEHLANYQKCAKEQRQLAEWLKDYKQLKEQEPCEDAIRREDAINAVSEALEHVLVENEDVARKMMNKLPSVNSQPKTGHWIPVSKENPIELDYYLATIKESSGEKVVRSVWHDGEWKLNSVVVQNVIAWQPLPAPFEPQESED